MAQNDIGIDLGTTTIIIAQEGKGVVLNQPSVVAMDTRKNTVLEAGDKALAMVGRTPNYISAIFPLKDGVISDHTMTRELICRFVKQVYSSHMVKPRVAVCGGRRCPSGVPHRRAHCRRPRLRHRHHSAGRPYDH